MEEQFNEDIDGGEGSDQLPLEFLDPVDNFTEADEIGLVGFLSQLMSHGTNSLRQVVEFGRNDNEQIMITRGGIRHGTLHYGLTFLAALMESMSSCAAWFGTPLIFWAASGL